MTVDRSDMYHVLEGFAEQCEEATKLAGAKAINDDIKNIVVAGMGGSAIAGDILKTYLADSKLRVSVIRDYTLSEPVDEKTLFFAVSYSGNTEETISAYREALKKKAKIVAISSGGKLLELSKMNQNEHIKIPSGLQPRNASGYLFFPMLSVLQNSKLIPNKSAEIKETVEKLQASLFIENAKHVADSLMGKIPIIYTSNKLAVVGYRWKTQFNENAKIHAFANVYSEFNHNEINGYVKKNGEFRVIQLMDDADHPRVQKRMQVVKDLIIASGVDVTTLVIKGKPLYKIFSAIYLGDWISYFLAVKMGVDPTPVDIIENLKKMLKE